MSLLAMRVLDDQVCDVMFSRKNNRVLRFKQNRCILEATSYSQYSLCEERIEVTYWTGPWKTVLQVP